MSNTRIRQKNSPESIVSRAAAYENPTVTLDARSIVILEMYQDLWQLASRDEAAIELILRADDVLTEVRRRSTSNLMKALSAGFEG